MADKKFIGSFHSEFDVLDEIEALKVQGVSENHMYVVTNDTERLSMVQGRTDVDLKSTEGNWIDRFKAFMTGDETVMAAFTNMGYKDEEATRFYNDIKQGAILLFVDKDYEHENAHGLDPDMSNDDVGMTHDTDMNNQNVGMTHDTDMNNQNVGMEHEEVDKNLGSNLTVDYSANRSDDVTNQHRDLNPKVGHDEQVSYLKKQPDVGKHSAQDEMATGEEFEPRHAEKLDKMSDIDQTSSGEDFNAEENTGLSMADEEPMMPGKEFTDPHTTGFTKTDDHQMTPDTDFKAEKETDFELADELQEVEPIYTPKENEMFNHEESDLNENDEVVNEMDDLELENEQRRLRNDPENFRKRPL